MSVWTIKRTKWRYAVQRRETRNPELGKEKSSEIAQLCRGGITQDLELGTKTPTTTSITARNIALSK